MLPAISVLPEPRWRRAEEAVVDGGGRVVPLEEAEALVWTGWGNATGLAAALRAGPGVRWVHLPGAGVDAFVDAGLVDDGRTWTCGKGAHSAIIAEHALALALAGLHDLAGAARATSWERVRISTLAGEPVTIVGAGGIANALVGLLGPFGCPVTVVRRRPEPVPGAARTVGEGALREAIGGARLTFLALALTSATHHLIGPAELTAMGPQAWLVNVSRGGLVDTDALVDALGAGVIAGAVLDVTDPEPLPDGHPLWTMPTCLITPHSAGDTAGAMGAMAARIGDNVRRWAAGEPLLGIIDPAAGY